jgi:uncharacterized Zn-finger protein
VRILGYILSGLLGLLGILFVVAAAASGLWPRYVVGGILIASGLVLAAVLRTRTPAGKVEVTQRIEIGGDASLENLACTSCGGALDETSVTLKAGAVFVSCPYCGASYRIEEAPRW